MIGCCSSFKECSDRASCIHEEGSYLHEELKSCYYKENLMKGLNFYTEYNENNQKRKQEYEREKEVIPKISSKNVTVETTQLVSNEEGQLSFF